MYQADLFDESRPVSRSQPCSKVAPSEPGPAIAADAATTPSAATTQTALPANLAQLDWVLRGTPPNRKLADMRSALRTIGRVLRRPLDQISTAPSELSGQLQNASPVLVGVNDARWSRVRSLLLTALVAGGLEILPGRDLQGYSPLWQALADQLPTKASRVGLSRLLSYLSRNGISPSEVTEDHLFGFGEVLKAASLRRDPVQSYRMAMRLSASFSVAATAVLRSVNGLAQSAEFVAASQDRVAMRPCHAPSRDRSWR